ncbi:MAG: hypothetical protein K0S57_3450 [Ramlibacter sp.]|nr:hypothetical protein [Ramlibacter sp.]
MRPACHITTRFSSTPAAISARPGQVRPVSASAMPTPITGKTTTTSIKRCET